MTDSPIEKTLDFSDSGKTITLTLCGIFSSKNGFSTNAKQLLENQTYEYLFNEEGYQLEKNPIVHPSHIKHKDNICGGTLITGSYVGMLDLRIRHNDHPIEPKLTVEVQSETMNYLEDYKSMMEDITGNIADLQLQLCSPVYSRLKSDVSKSKASAIQKLFFLLGLIQDNKFQSAIQMIINRPNSKWTEQVVTQDIRSSKRFTCNMLRQLVNAPNRIPVPESHPLHDRLTSISRTLEVNCLTESTDTQENQFVKYVLSFFSFELDRYKKEIIEKGIDNAQTILADADSIRKKLNQILGHDFFKRISSISHIPENSPLLQRKEGYRDVLRKWIQYRLGSIISWDGGEDIFNGGQRKLSTLYEYWCFFQLLGIMKKEFSVEEGKIDLNELIGEIDSGFGLKLKAGKELSLHGTYKDSNFTEHELNIRFSYNRTFSPTNELEKAGSWSLDMRPDYTISFWPTGLPESNGDKGEKKAEELNLITHVHFDAKYKASYLEKCLEQREYQVESETIEESKDEKTAKRVDILKMHSYRDAIRRTGGAYILYPGSKETPTRWQGFHELIPGLGAFSLLPDKSQAGINAITSFLNDLVKLLCDRISQWEQSTYFTYSVHDKGKYKHGDPKQYSLAEVSPSYKDGTRTAPLAKIEELEKIYILQVTSNARLMKWQVERGLYNLPIKGQDIRKIPFVKYLLQGKEILPVKYSRVVSFEDLQHKFNYTGTGTHGKNGYYLFKIIKPEDEAKRSIMKSSDLQEKYMARITSKIKVNGMLSLSEVF